MAERTPFIGLIRIAPGEPLSLEGFEFQFTDPLIVDHLLKTGAILHKHDGLAALANPATAPNVEGETEGGSISADTTVTLAYTWIDAQGGETLPSPVKAVVTGVSFPEPKEVPTAVVNYAAGGLLAANYVYGATVTDGEGGESILSPLVEAVVDAGHAQAEVTVSKLKTILTEVAGVTVGAEWRLWRRQNSGEWNLIDHGTGETVIDDGTLVPDCTVAPPAVATVRATNKLRVVVPKHAEEGEFFRLYLTTDGTFGPASLVAEYPISEAEKAIHLLTLATLPGAPPPVSRAIAHANQIDPDTDLIEWHWKRPVTKHSELPTEGNEEGDIRMVTETKRMYFWDSGAKEWEDIEGTSKMCIPATWSIAEAVTAGLIPGPSTLLLAGEEQNLIGATAELAEGEVELTLLHNGAEVAWLKKHKLKAGEELKVEGVIALASKDKLALHVVSASGSAKGLWLSAFIEHISAS